jgi:hypothetical protein
MPTNPAADAAEIQDTAATRMYPVWIAAISAAKSAQQGATPKMSAEVPEVPAVVVSSLQLAVIAALVAAWSSLRRRARTSPTSSPPPVRLRDVESRAATIVPEVAKEVWNSAQIHAAKTPKPTPKEDEKFSKAAARLKGLELMSLAQLELADDLGMKYKVWISRGDAKVRLLHRQLHGKPVKIGDPFNKWPTGQELGFPGDPRAPLDATINCRCLMFMATTQAGVSTALQPANLTEAFGIAASLEEKWLVDDDDHEQ